MGGSRQRGDEGEDPAIVGEAKTELPAPQPRWTAESLPTLPPDVRYEMLDEIGRGGMGKVLRAHDRRLDRPIAIKSLLGGREHVSRFLHEARITARLEHPGIVPVHDAGRLAGGEPFYAMKLVGGRTLHEAINQARGLGERLALIGSIIDVANTIAYAHSQRVIHRDLKPQNVLAGEFGETLVIDWGLSKEVGRDAKHPGGLGESSDPMETVEGSVMGTPAYMPPEQARGEALDYRTDVYAIGTLLYALLTAHAPHEGHTKVEVLAAARTKTPRPIRELEPGAPADLVAIAERAMAFDPDARYPSAQELAEDLKRFQTGRLVAARSYSMRQLALRWVRRHYALFVLAVLSTLVVGAIGVISVLRIVSAREIAETQRTRAEAREREAQKRAAQLMLTEARAQLGQDATAALVGLKRLVTSPAAHMVPVEEIREIALDAVSRGVIRHVMRGHDAQNQSVSATRDGTLAYSLAADGKLRVWDVARGEARGVADGVVGRVNSYALAPDGHVASGDDTGVALRDRNLRVQRRMTTGAPMRTVVFAGERVAGGGDDGKVVVWSRDGVELAALQLGGAITAVAAAPDGRLVAGTANGELTLWQPGTAPVIERLQDRIRGLAVDRTGNVAVVGDRGLYNWRPGHDRPRLALAAERRDFARVSFSETGRWLAVANSVEGFIFDRSMPGAAPVEYDRVDDVAFDPTSTIAVITKGDGLVVRDLASGIDRQLPLFRNAVGVAFAGPSRVVVGGVDGEVFVLDLDSLIDAQIIPVPGPARAVMVRGDAALAYTLDGQVIEVADGRVTTLSLGGHVRAMWPAVEPRAIFVTHDGAIARVDFASRQRTAVTGEVGAARCVIVSGDRVAFVDDDRVLHVREQPDREARYPQPDEIARCTLAPDGTLVVGTDAGKVRRIDLHTGAVVAEDHGHRGVVTELTVTADGTVLYASTDGTVRAWRGKDSRVLARHGMPVWGVSTANGLVASSSSDRTIRIMKLDGTLVRILRGHSNDVSGVAFASDGSWLVSSSLDGTLRRWRIGSDSPPHTLEDLATWLDAHTSVRPPD